MASIFPCYGLENTHKCRIVLVVSKQSEAFAQDMIRTVTSQLSDMDTSIREEWIDSLPKEMAAQFALVRDISSGASVDIVVWYEQTDKGDVLLFISDSKSERMLARRLPATDEGGQSEALALIVRSAVETVSLGGIIGEPSPELSVSAPPEAQVAISATEFSVRPVNRGALAVQVGGTVAIRSSETILMGGGEFKVNWRPFSFLMIGVGYTLWQPIQVDHSLASIKIDRHPIAVYGGYIKRIGVIDLRMELVWTVDIETQSTREVSVEGAGVYNNINVLLSLSPVIGLDINFHRYIFLYVSGGVALSIRQAKYAYRSEDTIIVLEHPWRWQPYIALGVGFRFF